MNAERALVEKVARRTIRLWFAGFWPGFNKHDNHFTRMLKRRHDLVVSKHADYLIYSVFSKEFQRYPFTRILYTGENVRPDFTQCDYAFSFDYLDDARNFRLPLYRLQNSEAQLTRARDTEKIIQQPRKFCNMVVSNPNARERIDFFHRLSKQKKVDSGGRYLNNVGGPVADKHEFIRQYKFTLAFENSSFPGYTTEKLVQPWMEGSIPIYWGNPRIGEEFNPESFINIHAFPDWDAAIAHILEVDADEALYRRYIQAPLFHGGRLPIELSDEAILDQFDWIFSLPGSSWPRATARQLLDIQAQKAQSLFWRAVGSLRRRF